MNTNQIIYLNQYRSSVRSHHSCVRSTARKSTASALYLIENAVTAAIGLCVLFSMILVVTML